MVEFQLNVELNLLWWRSILSQIYKNYGNLSIGDLVQVLPIVHFGVKKIDMKNIQ